MPYLELAGKIKLRNLVPMRARMQWRSIHSRFKFVFDILCSSLKQVDDFYCGVGSKFYVYKVSISVSKIF